MAKAVQAQNPSFCNRLTLIEIVTPPRTRTHRGIFKCQCGNEIEASIPNVTRGHTRSCGCLRREIAKMTAGVAHTHGHFVNGRPSGTYVSWQAMIARCTNPKHRAFEHYRALGIAVCDRWLHSFPAFLADVGERPDGKTLDRWPNNLGNYEPGNVRWATKAQQQRNRIDNRCFDFRGEKLTAAEIYERSGSNLTAASFRHKLYRGGGSI